MTEVDGSWDGQAWSACDWLPKPGSTKAPCVPSALATSQASIVLTTHQNGETTRLVASIAVASACSHLKCGLRGGEASRREPRVYAALPKLWQDIKRKLTDYF